MGMDVSGINPTNENGKYFRANIWSWPSIHELISEVSAEEGGLLTEDQLRAMCHNDGAPGVVERSVLDKIASGLQRKVDAARQLSSSKIIISRKESAAPTKQLAQLIMGQLGGGVADDSAFSTDVEHVQEFVDFLKGCGDGFEVW
jgi:hypothetical protein